MKKQKSIIYIIMIAFIVLFILNSCSMTKNKEIAPIKYDESIARFVNSVTSGIINPQQNIVIKFQSPIVTEDKINKIEKNKILKFEPNISGKIYWQSSDTLIFKPDSSFKENTMYICSTELGNFHEGISKKLKFSFLVKKIRINSFSYEFVNIDDSKANSVIFQAKCKFSQPVVTEDLDSSFFLKIKGKNLKLKVISEDNKSQTIKLSSDIIEKTNKDYEGVFLFDSKNNQKYFNFDKKVKLFALNKFEPIKHDSILQEKKIYLTVSFTNEIDETQDFRGFVDIYPDIDFNVYANGSKLFISGDFKNGTNYKVILREGLKAKANLGSLNTDFSGNVMTQSLQPSIEYTSKGIFLPTDNNKNLRFQTVNLNSARLIILKVFENNLTQFLQDNSINENSKNRSECFNSVNRVGIEVYNDKIDFLANTDEVIQHEIDLSKIINQNDSGIYIVSLFFTKDDIIEKTNNNEESENEDYDEEYGEEDYEDGYYYDDYSYSRNYYSDDNSYYSMIYKSRGQIHKALSISDIGLVTLIDSKGTTVFARDIITTLPIENAEITLVSYQNQVIAKGKTDKDGKAFLPKSNSEVFYIKAEKNSQRSFVKISDMTLNTSSYDVGGIEVRKNDLRFFAYTERGIYRPGDEINFTAIIRNQQNTFAENHPVILRMYNPRNNLVYEQINKEGIDGVYVFKVKTSFNDFTGNWTANFVLAGETFTVPVKIETIVPYTIKARMTSSESKLSIEKTKTTIDIDVQYLVGLPAAGLSYSVNVEYLYPPKKFSNLVDYNFDDKSFSTNIKSDEYYASGTIDSDGKAKFDYILPNFEIKPSSMICLFTLRVIEKSGRPVIFKLAIPVEFYQYYVGYKLPSSYGAYAKQGATIPISIVDLKSDGSYAKGRKIKWTAYHSRWWWWWDYYYNSNFALNFKNRESTVIHSKGNLTSVEGPTTLNLKFENYGTYYIELEEENGHISSFFVFVYGWGMDSSSKDANFLILRSDKKEYKPGENAVISFPASKTGKVLVSIEHANQIIKSYWVDSKVDENMEMNINVPIDNTMTPNIYITIMLIQPHSETTNDRPIRMYGILPLNVVDVSTKQEINVKVADVIKPNKTFSIEIQTNDNKPAQMTVAVVDEGLLDLTAFETPDPWKEFNKKLKMGVNISDIYDNIINLNTGAVKNRFSVGGADEAAKFARAQSADTQAERFKPVSFFKGPLKTDENGYLKVSFDMPNYIGSVRIMVISINGNRYGSFEKAVKVREELMVSASLPRILRPTDSIKVPVTILAMEKNLGKITVTATVNGEAKITGDNKQEIVMTKEGEQTIYFNLTANEAIGLIEFNVEATNGSYFSSQKTQLDCLAGSTRLYGSDYFTVARGESKKFKIPVVGLKGSNEAEIIVSTLLPKNLQKRLSYLIHYPYGCIEQTVSGAFPQLYLPEIIELSKEDREKIDFFINEAIKKIRKMQLSDGAFSYWPDSSNYNLWSTHYAAHFLIEAKNKGYNVPSDMIEKWQDFAKKSLKKDIGKNTVISTYACYLLALSGKPDVASMNIIWTLYKEKLSEPFKLLLAASYKLAGSSAISSNVFSLALKRKFQEYFDNDETFGSQVRDYGLTLLAYMALDKDYEASQLFNEIVKEIQTDYFYSTQETSFLLLSMGKYITEKASALDSSGKKGVIQGTITYPSGKKVNFSTEKKSIKIPINSDFGKEFTIELDSKTYIPVAYVDVISSGIPLLGATKPVSNKITFGISYYDENGILIQNNKFQKGKQYWVQIVITNGDQYRYNNIAIAHLLPAGLEYEQYRSTYKNRPEFDKQSWGYIQPQYIDIRDDRAFIFTDIWWYQSVFYLKVNAVTVGKFLMPSSYAEAMYKNDIYAYTAAGYCEVVDTGSNPLAKPKN